MVLNSEHKDSLNRWCDRTLASIEKEMAMVDEEVEKMRSEPRRCPICDYERMVKSRHYLWETVQAVLAVKGMTQQ